MSASIWEGLPLAIAFVAVVFGMPITMGVLLSWAAKRGRPFRQRWADRLARVAGGQLVVTPGTDYSFAKGEGEVDGSKVAISAVALSKRGILVDVRVDTGVPLSASPAIWPRSAGPETGDAAFDAAVDIHGDRELIASLTQEIRDEIRALTNEGASMRSGTWGIEKGGSLFESEEALDALVLRLVALGAAMRSAARGERPEEERAHTSISAQRATGSAER